MNVKFHICTITQIWNVFNMAVFLHTHTHTHGLQYPCETMRYQQGTYLNEIKLKWNNNAVAHIGGMKITVNVGFVFGCFQHCSLTDRVWGRQSRAFPTQTLPTAGWDTALLKHLTASLRELESQEASDSQSPRCEEDGHRFSDAHERLKDADAQNCS